MPKLKDENKLLDIQKATMKLVLQTGFNSLKMADVAIEANVATGTLYVYYKSKELLINDLYAKTKKEMISVMLNPEHATGDFHTTFKNMWYAYFNFCFDNAEKLFFVEQFIYSGLITAEIVADIENNLIPLNQFIAYGQQNKLFKKMDIDLVKAQLHGAVHETVRVLLKQHKTLPPIEVDRCFGITWDGLKHR